MKVLGAYFLRLERLAAPIIPKTDPFARASLKNFESHRMYLVRSREESVEKPLDVGQVLA